MTKPTVHYTGGATVLGVGMSAWLTPVDHPNHLEFHNISNMMEVRTSTVVAYDEATGRIETKNTIYVPEVKA